MAGGIYLIRDEELVDLSEQPYESEDLLQELLAKYPNVLAGDKIDATQRQWLLISREIGVASGEEGADRWSLDHLFVDQDGLPTLVEVKRSSDTRIRREVVGQMLDYAANGVVYWPIERLRGSFESECETVGLDPGMILRDRFGDSLDGDNFWTTIESNLRAGRVRLVFVADAIPPELARVIEFLNGQMTPAEVIGIEIKQYVGAGMRTLVPRVVGATAEAQQRKGKTPSARRQWSEETFLDALRSTGGEEAVATARAVISWAGEYGLRDAFGTGPQIGSYFPTLDHAGNWYAPVGIYTSNVVELQFLRLREKPPFNDEGVLQEYIDRFRAIAGVVIPADAERRLPSIRLNVFASPDGRAALIGVLSWFVEVVRSQ